MVNLKGRIGLLPLALAFFLACSSTYLVPTARSQLLPVPIVDPAVGGNASQIQTYIVHVYPPEDVELLGAEEELLENWHKSFLPNTTLDSGEPRLVYSYHRVISGFAARLTPNEVKAMEKMNGFVSAEPKQHLRLGTTYTPTFLGLNQYNSFWEKSGLGEGVIIGVLDSGIVPTHPSFDDKGMPEPPLKWRGCCEFNNTVRCNKWVPNPCNNKLIGAAAFGSRTPDDEVGHGTHVAGIAAGNFVDGAHVLGQAEGTAAGMAPRAHLAVYRVCKRSGCENHNILAGIEKAMDDGVDVLSMSIIVKGSMHQNSIAQGTFKAMEKGIISVCCAGNEGPKPSSIANDAPWILTVGASSIDRVARATVRLGNGMEFDGESAYQPEDFDYSPMMPMAYPAATAGTVVKRACLAGAFDDMNITGKIVLCGHDGGDPVVKGKLVKAAGGVALIVLNQRWDNFTIRSDPHVIPAAHLNHEDSLKAVDYFSTEENATATIIFKGTQYGSRGRAPAVASFSSRGPSLVNGPILKPDIIGPGVDILSAWHEEVGPPNHSDETNNKIFNFALGCSMATPHLAGVAALLSSSHPDWSPAAIKSAIMTTAYVTDREGKPIADEASGNMDPASVFAMGAGHVNPSAANDPGLIYDIKPEEYVGYLCGLGYSTSQVFKIVGRFIQCSTSVQKITPLQLNLPSISVMLTKSLLNEPGAIGAGRTTTVLDRTVTNVGEANSVFSVIVDEPDGVNVKVTPEKLEFPEQGRLP